MPSHEVDNTRFDNLLKLVTDIVAAYVSNNPVPVADLPAMIRSVHATLGGLSGGDVGDAQTSQKPAISVKKSVTPEYLICLEDGKKLKMLKRYLRSRYGLSPDQYRAKWGLPADYPMVASNYAAQRSDSPKRSAWASPRARVAAGAKDRRLERFSIRGSPARLFCFLRTYSSFATAFCVSASRGAVTGPKTHTSVPVTLSIAVTLTRPPCTMNSM